MKTVLILVALAVAAYFVWMNKLSNVSSPNGTNLTHDQTAGANAANRIDNLSGAAPQE